MSQILRFLCKFEWYKHDRAKFLEIVSRKRHKRVRENGYLGLPSNRSPMEFSSHPEKSLCFWGLKMNKPHTLVTCQVQGGGYAILILLCQLPGDRQHEQQSQIWHVTRSLF
jgi:hypothetical protein